MYIDGFEKYQRRLILGGNAGGILGQFIGYEDSSCSSSLLDKKFHRGNEACFSIFCIRVLSLSGSDHRKDQVSWGNAYGLAWHLFQSDVSHVNTRDVEYAPWSHPLSYPALVKDSGIAGFLLSHNLLWDGDFFKFCLVLLIPFLFISPHLSLNNPLIFHYPFPP